MGTGASHRNVGGVTANPRVVYNETLAKKEQKAQVLDAPVLVDVQHGSVRYRYESYEGEPTDKSRRIEKPFEGQDTRSKQNYFYHTRLRDFSQGADRSKEDDFKFMYVTRGPARAQQKKLYYVYGRSLEARDGTRVKPTETKEEGNDYSWPGLRVPNHLYYRLEFPGQGTPVATREVTTSPEAAPIEVKSVSPDMRFTLEKLQTTRELKAKIAVSIQKSASDVHVCVDNTELKDDNIVSTYQIEEKDGSEEKDRSKEREGSEEKEGSEEREGSEEKEGSEEREGSKEKEGGEEFEVELFRI